MTIPIVVVPRIKRRGGYFAYALFGGNWSDPNEVVLVCPVWETDPPPNTARVGNTRYRGRPLLTPPPVVSDPVPGPYPKLFKALGYTFPDRLCVPRAAALFDDSEWYIKDEPPGLKRFFRRRP